jgi:FdhE protein
VSPSGSQRLDELAQTDQALAPLARLQAAVLRAAADPAWENAVPPLDRRRLESGLPLLHGATLQLAPGQVRTVLVMLVEIASRSGQAEAERVGQGLQTHQLDPLAVLDASLEQDTDALVALAMQADVDLGLLTTLGQIATLPLLQACGRQAAPLLEGVSWEAGFCPTCAAWPTLAELRGLERKRWLRCGRCGASWWCYQQRCSFCASIDHKLQGYLAPERDRESRRAMTCDNCHNYLKALTTISQIPGDEIGLHDLTSIELDLAALEHGYGRPETPGFPLELDIVPSPDFMGAQPHQ